ncbi:uncharacterized protein K441DRAFT_576376 [Cenococcum geophilum 1.58]|uniref:uncharacterized protein n=1 Tax=Cenococcum geophilum 1.58 TaxID=794803 RepID=UPI00358F580E|nr:hypothetical protein K441DRAFT_576376 [Cenococcum geophilum 1.58]
MPAPHPLDELLARVHSFIKRPPSLVFVFVLVVLLELEESVQKVPTIRLLENAICQKHYQDETLSGPINESMCKTEFIQVRLAHIRGLLSFFDSLPIILLGSSFGSNADRNGRRFAFSLAILGIICAMIWIYFTCHFWDSIPIEAVWAASLFHFIGGGPNFAIAMCLTMASDLSTDATRSINFYRVYSAVLITDLIGPPVTYATLEHSLWLPYLVCGLTLSLTYPVTTAMPETLHKVAKDQDVTPGFESIGIQTYLNFLKDWRVFVGIMTVFLAQFRVNTIEILLPYISVRFGLKLAQAATLLPIMSAVNIIVFLMLLPAIFTYLEKKAGWSINLINIYVVRVSSGLLAFGAAILAAASNLAVIVVALAVYATGFGVRLSILAVLTTYVNSSKQTARLYTLVATTDAIAHTIASPLLQFVWGKALEFGGRWIVLPFLVLMVLLVTPLPLPSLILLGGFHIGIFDVLPLKRPIAVSLRS